MKTKSRTLKALFRRMARAGLLMTLLVALGFTPAISASSRPRKGTAWVANGGQMSGAGSLSLIKHRDS